MRLAQSIAAAALLFAASGVPAVGPSAPPAPGLDHIGIQSSDLDRSVAFYTSVLDLKEVPAPFPRAEARWLVFGNGEMLHIVAHGRSDVAHNKWDHFALACADLKATIARLDALHVPWTDMNGAHVAQVRPDGVTQVFLRDPDGYEIELNDGARR